MSDFWKPTAELYEQLFEKPKMTEKLLSKPPFRYLHDIFLATMQATGFGDGIYTEAELDSKANHEKDAKMSILSKMITLTEMVIGEKIDVKPSNFTFTVESTGALEPAAIVKLAFKALLGKVSLIQAALRPIRYAGSSVSGSAAAPAIFKSHVQQPGPF